MHEDTTQRIVEAVKRECGMNFRDLLQAGFKPSDVARAVASGHIRSNIYGEYSSTF
jgi:hypothetical protein